MTTFLEGTTEPEMYHHHLFLKCQPAIVPRLLPEVLGVVCVAEFCGSDHKGSCLTTSKNEHGQGIVEEAKFMRKLLGKGQWA